MLPSRTARRVAERRAAHQLLDAPVVLKDPLALRIVGVARPEERARLAAMEQGRLARTLRAFLAARARVAEDELARRAAEGLRQYVILGAGLDTFAYRNPFSDSLRVFEVDQEGTQVWKRECLADAGIAPDASVSFVSVDFEHGDVFEALRQSGWDRMQPTLFAWLGVTMYLDEETVLHVLRTMACLAPGTQVVFDYAIAPTLLGPIERLVFDEFAKRVAALPASRGSAGSNPIASAGILRRPDSPASRTWAPTRSTGAISSNAPTECGSARWRTSSAQSSSV